MQRENSAHTSFERDPVYIALDFDGVLHATHGAAHRDWTAMVAAGKWSAEDFAVRIAEEYALDAEKYVKEEEECERLLGEHYKRERKYNVDYEVRFPFERSGLLEMVLALHPEVRLIIATAWRIGMTVEQLREIMPPRLAARVVGKLDDEKETSQGYPIPGIRGDLMTRWMKQHASASSQWLAIDDTWELWKNHQDRLVQPIGLLGLQTKDAHALRVLLSSFAASGRQSPSFDQDWNPDGPLWPVAA